MGEFRLPYHGAGITMTVMETDLGRFFVWQYQPLSGDRTRFEMRMSNTLNGALSEGERLALWRNGNVFDRAEGSWLGRQGDGPGFEGFQKALGRSFHLVLHAHQFLNNDEIKILPSERKLACHQVPHTWNRQIWGLLTGPYDEAKNLYYQ